MSEDRIPALLYIIPAAFLGGICWLFGYACAREPWINAYRNECIRRGGRVMTSGSFEQYCVVRADTVDVGPKP
jgi:hypothetical protein